jgi:cytochrome c oxidase subunit 1
MLKLGWQEKWTLRYAVVALLFLALAGFEGIMMRSQLISPTSLAGMEAAMASLRGGSQSGPAELFYSVITVHPIVGIYGFAYMAVFGAFYFLVPFLLNKPVRHKRLVPINFWLQIGGVLVCWGAGFFALFNATYTLY